MVKSRNGELLLKILHEAGSHCSVPTERDGLTITWRIESEGDGFLTITLPSFAKAFDKALDDGRITSVSFLNFKKVKKGSVIPAFLQGFLRLIFSDDGSILDEVSVVAIRAVRQICRTFAKVFCLCSDARTKAAISDFVEIDRNLNVDLETDHVRRTRIVLQHILTELPDDPDELFTRFHPRHGSGSVSDRIRGNRKWLFPHWSSRLVDVGLAPWSIALQPAAFSCSLDSRQDDSHPVQILDPDSELDSKLCPVPKTQKTPRLISIEPSYAQYAQQGVRKIFLDHIEGSAFGRNLNFRFQSVNQKQALLGSVNGDLATLDLSEASDRVSWDLVKFLFRYRPNLLRLIDATRTRNVQLPDGTKMPLKKFASMGSALTFVIESLIFYSSIIASIGKAEGAAISRTTTERIGRRVFVYGDDLIVPNEHALSVSSGLTLLGFKINETKSFWTGRFRESCGVDAYAGEQVQPVYLRQPAPENRKDARQIVSWVATANQLYGAGYTEAAYYMAGIVEKVIGKLPDLFSVPFKPLQQGFESAALAWTFPTGTKTARRLNQNLQRLEYRCWVCSSVSSSDPLSGYGALAKCLVPSLSPRSGEASGHGMYAMGDDLRVIHGTGRLERSSRPYALVIKRKWVAY